METISHIFAVLRTRRNAENVDTGWVYRSESWDEGKKLQTGFLFGIVKVGIDLQCKQLEKIKETCN